MLAADDITLTIGGETLFLRPSLRAAIRLERNHGLPALAEGITTGSVTVLSAILVECGAPADVFHGLTFGDAIPEAAVAAMSLVVELYGLDEKPQPGEAHGPTLTHAEAFAGLYRAATGWLGWTPEAALDATPAEITEAAKGRHELIGDILKAVFGSPDNDDPSPSAPSSSVRSFTSKEILERAEAERDVAGLKGLAALSRAA